MPAVQSNYGWTKFILHLLETTKRSLQFSVVWLLKINCRYRQVQGSNSEHDPNHLAYIHTWQSVRENSNIIPGL